jgi:hypothetical protein
MVTYPQKLAQDTAFQNHIGRLTERLFLLNWPKGFILINEPKYRPPIDVFHQLLRVMFRAHILHRLVVHQAYLHEYFQLAQVVLGTPVEDRWYASNTLILNNPRVMFQVHI